MILCLLLFEIQCFGGAVGDDCSVFCSQNAIDPDHLDGTLEGLSLVRTPAAFACDFLHGEFFFRIHDDKVGIGALLQDASVGDSEDLRNFFRICRRDSGQRNSDCKGYRERLLDRRDT